MAGYISYPRTVGDNTYIKQRLKLLNQLLNSGSITDIYTLISLIGYENLPAWAKDKLSNFLQSNKNNLHEEVKKDNINYIESFLITLVLTCRENNSDYIQKDTVFKKVVSTFEGSGITLNESRSPNGLVFFQSENNDYFLTENYIKSDLVRASAYIELNSLNSVVRKHKHKQKRKVPKIIYVPNPFSTHDYIKREQEKAIIEKNATKQSLISALFIAIERGDLERATGILSELGINNAPSHIISNYFSLKNKKIVLEPLLRLHENTERLKQSIVDLENALLSNQHEIINIHIYCIIDALGSMVFHGDDYLTSLFIERIAYISCLPAILTLPEKELEKLLSLTILIYKSVKASENTELEQKLKKVIKIASRNLNSCINEDNWYLYYFISNLINNKTQQKAIDDYFFKQKQLSTALIEFVLTKVRLGYESREFTLFMQKLLNQDREIIDSFSALQELHSDFEKLKSGSAGSNVGFFNFSEQLF